MNGVAFYQRDKENMQRYPPHYGLQKDSARGSEDNKQSKEYNT